MIRLVDLDPKWLVHNGKRVGFTFLSPAGKQGSTHWRQSCFPDPPSRHEQWDLFGDDDVQGCDPAAHWQITGGIDAASFETMTVTPSLDGSAGGLWHGFITNGEVR